MYDTKFYVKLDGYGDYQIKILKYFGNINFTESKEVSDFINLFGKAIVYDENKTNYEKYGKTEPPLKDISEYTHYYHVTTIHVTRNSHGYVLDSSWKRNSDGKYIDGKGMILDRNALLDQILNKSKSEKS